MRREFYLSRGQEVPDEFVAGAAGGTGGTGGDAYEEHVRALEEQWIEGDLNNETAQSKSSRLLAIAYCAHVSISSAVNEGLYSSILHGILIGFLLPLLPWFFFRELPSPNFFDPLEGPDAPPSRAPTDEDRLEGDGEGGDATRSGNESTTATREAHSEPMTAASMFGLRGLPGGDWRTGVVFGQRTQVSSTECFYIFDMKTDLPLLWVDGYPDRDGAERWVCWSAISRLDRYRRVYVQVVYVTPQVECFIDRNVCLMVDARDAKEKRLNA